MICLPINQDVFTKISFHCSSYYSTCRERNLSGLVPNAYTFLYEGLGTIVGCLTKHCKVCCIVFEAFKYVCYNYMQVREPLSFLCYSSHSCYMSCIMKFQYLTVSCITCYMLCIIHEFFCCALNGK